MGCYNNLGGIDDSLLFFFLLLVIIFCMPSFCGGMSNDCAPRC